MSGSSTNEKDRLFQIIDTRRFRRDDGREEKYYGKATFRAIRKSQREPIPIVTLSQDIQNDKLGRGPDDMDRLGNNTWIVTTTDL